MRGDRFLLLRRAAVGATLLGAVAFAGNAQAGNSDIVSLASQFLQSKTQITILSHDDQAAPNCQQKRFVKASPVVQPTVAMAGSITERKWQEMWTLERCGTPVNYWVFFTEVGNGGAYYAIVGPQKAEAAK